MDRFSQTRQILQMEEDVDLEMLQEREDSIKKLEVNTFYSLQRLANVNILSNVTVLSCILSLPILMYIILFMQMCLRT